MSGLYIHIPFCRNKCIYCDFYSGGSRIADWESYVSCLLNELDCRHSEIKFPVNTLYIGGGTPSLMPPEHFSNLIAGLRSRIKGMELSEFTIEVNPEDVSNENIGLWKNEGVNRVSIGVQSLQDSELKALGRKHDSDSAMKALKMVIENFDNVSADIIFGIPGQTLKSYSDTLAKVISLRPHHVSSYSLMLEEGTAMTYLTDTGKVRLPGEDEWLRMYQLTIDTLKKNGYNRYEISNYSFPGKESLHNSSYWEGIPYLGLGPGAHSYDGKGIRRANPKDLKGYIRRYAVVGTEYNPSFYKEEKLSSTERREEMVMTRLRTSNGLDLKAFAESFGEDGMHRLIKEAEKYVEYGDIVFEDGRLFFTDKGYMISDSIISRLI